jgi:hypothetical protein
MTAPSIDPRQLNDLSIAEVFEKYVLKDPAVVPLAAAALQKDKSFLSVFQEGQYPGPFVEYAWPLDITPEDLARRFVKPVVYFVGDPDPVISKELVDVSAALVARIGAIKDLLTSGKLIARGTFAKTGMVGEVGRLQWARREISIDVRNSDLLDNAGREPVVMWSGITLELPAPTALNGQMLDAQPPVRGKGTPHRSSIDAAIAAIWPEGIPRGLTVKDRDGQINDWQDKNGQVVTSGKTIKRHLKGE